MSAQPKTYDERDVSIANDGFRIGYFILGFGVMVYILTQHFVNHQPNWSLMAIFAISYTPAIFLQQTRKSYMAPKIWIWIISFIWALFGLALAAHLGLFNSK